MTDRPHRAETPVDITDWDDPVAIGRRHRKQLAGLLIAYGVIAVLAIVISPYLLWCALLLSPFVLFELWMVSRTRETVRIPDFRPPDTVEVELDEQ